MRKYMKNFMKAMRSALDDPDTDLDSLEKIFLTKIGFFSHERLVHLIVCVMVVIAMFISFLTTIVSGLDGFAVVSLILLVLTAFYLEHYYFLENSVQKMYKMYDELKEKQHSAETEKEPV